MKLRTSYSRTAMSLALTMAVATVFTLNSFAAPEANKSAGESIAGQIYTGTLTVKSGEVTLNGNAAQTGATVLTGSVITTSKNGEAIVDLGALGRVEIGDHTSVTLTCVASLLEIRTTCKKTDVEVRRGTLAVTSPKTETLAAGQDEGYDDGIVATSTGGLDVKLECEGRKTGAGLFVAPGLLGLLALILIGAKVAIGTPIDDSGGGVPPGPPPSSPIR